MSVNIITMSQPPVRQRGHAKALPCPDLNQPLRLRVGHLQTLYGLSHSAVYVHLKKGLIPPNDGAVGRRRYWRTDTIRAALSSDVNAINQSAKKAGDV
jgi:hypothetical protein